VVIDVGANVSCTALHLLQFAQMGIAYQKCLGIAEPKVALLNIGVEKDKGSKTMREAYRRLESLNQNDTAPVFVGNLEGREVFKGIVDVLVTDGVSGNILLKTTEGTTAFLLKKLVDIHPTPLAKEDTLIKLLDYAEYPGALICGIEGVVVKCHGYSNPNLPRHYGSPESRKEPVFAKIKNTTETLKGIRIVIDRKRAVVDNA